MHDISEGIQYDISNQVWEVMIYHPHCNAWYITKQIRYERIGYITPIEMHDISQNGIQHDISHFKSTNYSIDTGIRSDSTDHDMLMFELIINY